MTSQSQHKGSYCYCFAPHDQEVALLIEVGPYSLLVGHDGSKGDTVGRLFRVH